jgi:protein involved in polysaccharide export with SLBB domain
MQMRSSSTFPKFLWLMLCLLAMPSLAAAAEEYVLAPGDVVAVTVFGEPDLSLEKAPITAVGTLSMPLLGDIKAAGLTQNELEATLTERLSDGYLKKPEVTVTIVEYRPFYISGAVSTPGSYPYKEGLTVEKAVALAGGFTPRASKRKITVVREVDASRTPEDAELSTPLGPGDVVTVGESLF